MIELLLRRPLLVVAIYTLLVGALIGVQVAHHTQQIKEATVRQAAESYSAAITQFRDYYSNEVVPRARKAGVEVTHDFHDKEAAIPLPATLTIELGDRLTKEGGGRGFRIFSEFPRAGCSTVSSRPRSRPRPPIRNSLMSPSRIAAARP